MKVSTRRLLSDVKDLVRIPSVEEMDSIEKTAARVSNLAAGAMTAGGLGAGLLAGATGGHRKGRKKGQREGYQVGARQGYMVGARRGYSVAQQQMRAKIRAAQAAKESKKGKVKKASFVSDVGAGLSRNADGRLTEQARHEMRMMLRNRWKKKEIGTGLRKADALRAIKANYQNSGLKRAKALKSIPHRDGTPRVKIPIK